MVNLLTAENNVFSSSKRLCLIALISRLVDATLFL